MNPLTSKDIMGLMLIARVQDMSPALNRRIHCAFSPFAKRIAAGLKKPSKNARVRKAVKHLRTYAARQFPPHPDTVRYNYLS